MEEAELPSRLGVVSPRIKLRLITTKVARSKNADFLLWHLQGASVPIYGIFHFIFPDRKRWFTKVKRNREFISILKLMEGVSPADQVINSFQALSLPTWHVSYFHDRATLATYTSNNLSVALSGFYKAITQPRFPACLPAYHQQRYEVTKRIKYSFAPWEHSFCRVRGGRIKSFRSV